MMFRPQDAARRLEMRRITVFIREQKGRQVPRQEVQAKAQALKLSCQVNWLHGLWIEYRY